VASSQDLGLWPFSHEESDILKFVSQSCHTQNDVSQHTNDSVDIRKARSSPFHVASGGQRVLLPLSYSQVRFIPSIPEALCFGANPEQVKIGTDMLVLLLIDKGDDRQLPRRESRQF
jgi:hypothetical protein